MSVCLSVSQIGGSAGKRWGGDRVEGAAQYVFLLRNVYHCQAVIATVELPGCDAHVPAQYGGGGLIFSLLFTHVRGRSHTGNKVDMTVNWLPIVTLDAPLISR